MAMRVALLAVAVLVVMLTLLGVGAWAGATGAVRLTILAPTSTPTLRPKQEPTSTRVPDARDAWIRAAREFMIGESDVQTVIDAHLAVEVDLNMNGKIGPDTGKRYEQALDDWQRVWDRVYLIPFPPDNDGLRVRDEVMTARKASQEYAARIWVLVVSPTAQKDARDRVLHDLYQRSRDAWADAHSSILVMLRLHDISMSELHLPQ